MSHTHGPWFSDEFGNVWRRNPSDLYENGGSVAGEKPVATANKGWFGDGYTGYPVIANARLIAAAPELLDALESCHMALIGYTHQNEITLKAIAKAKAAEKKARG